MMELHWPARPATQASKLQAVRDNVCFEIGCCPMGVSPMDRGTRDLGRSCRSICPENQAMGGMPMVLFGHLPTRCLPRGISRPKPARHFNWRSLVSAGWNGKRSSREAAESGTFTPSTLPSWFRRGVLLQLRDRMLFPWFRGRGSCRCGRVSLRRYRCRWCG
jgi:hypothetical protein